MGALRLDVVTIFPDYLKVLDLSLIGRAAGDGLITPVVHDLREWADDRRRTVDGPPVGGGAGMVMRPDVWGRALDRVLAAPIGGAATSGGTAPRTGGAARRVLVMPAPSGDLFTQRTAEDLAGADQIVFACGRYEGIDARVAEHYRDAGVEVRELSIGDYVLGGGEAAASRWAGDWKRRATTHVPAAISAAPARSAAHGRRRRTGFTGFRPLP